MSISIKDKLDELRNRVEATRSAYCEKLDEAHVLANELRALRREYYDVQRLLGTPAEATAKILYAVTE